MVPPARLPWLPWLLPPPPPPAVHSHPSGVKLVIVVGAHIGRPTCLPPAAAAAAAAAACRAGLGVKLVIVVGARMQINEAVRARGMEPCYASGYRVTDPDTMQVRGVG